MALGNEGLSGGYNYAKAEELLQKVLALPENERTELTAPFSEMQGFAIADTLQFLHHAIVARM